MPHTLTSDQTETRRESLLVRRLQHCIGVAHPCARLTQRCRRFLLPAELLAGGCSVLGGFCRWRQAGRRQQRTCLSGPAGRVDDDACGQLGGPAAAAPKVQLPPGVGHTFECGSNCPRHGYTGRWPGLCTPRRLLVLSAWSCPRRRQPPCAAAIAACWQLCGRGETLQLA